MPLGTAIRSEAFSSAFVDGVVRRGDDGEWLEGRYRARRPVAGRGLLFVVVHLSQEEMDRRLSSGRGRPLPSTPQGGEVWSFAPSRR